MKTDRKMDLGFYVAGWCLLVVGTLYLLVIKLTGVSVSQYMLPCVFHLCTGYYCPGCGGTRAVIALLEGRVWDSFRYQPFVLYAAVICGWFMLSQTIERLSRGRWKIGMHYRDIYLWIAVAIIAINTLVKNLFLIKGIDLLNI